MALQGHTVAQARSGASRIPCSTTDESGSTHYLYDGFGRTTAKIQTMGNTATVYTVAYQYGSSGSDNGHGTAITCSRFNGIA